MANTILNYRGKNVYIIFNEDRDVIGCYVTRKDAKKSLVEYFGSRKQVEEMLEEGEVAIEKTKIDY